MDAVYKRRICVWIAIWKATWKTRYCEGSKRKMFTFPWLEQKGRPSGNKSGPPLSVKQLKRFCYQLTFIYYIYIPEFTSASKTKMHGLHSIENFGDLEKIDFDISLRTRVPWVNCQCTHESHLKMKSKMIFFFFPTTNKYHHS